MSGFAECEPFEFDTIGNMIDMFSEILPREAKIEWLEKWEKRLEDKLARIRHMLSEERKKGEMRDERTLTFIYSLLVGKLP